LTDEHFAKAIYRRRFNLRNVDLSGADLRDLFLRRIDFTGSSFRNAAMMNSVVSKVLFNGSDFTDANTRTTSAEDNCIFSYCLFEGRDAVSVIEPLMPNQVLGCAIKSMDLQSSCDLHRLLQDKDNLLGDWFGDASVILPGGHGPEHENWPPHWPKAKLDDDEFRNEWHRWLATPDTYTPPE
jgi:uncharacterized protein YjbI with pentapeptide repeats